MLSSRSCYVPSFYDPDEGWEEEYENFDKTDEGESHAEAKSATDVCNEGCQWHHLVAKNNNNKDHNYKNMHLIRMELWQVGWIKVGIDPDKVFRCIIQQLFLKLSKVRFTHIETAKEVIGCKINGEDLFRNLVDEGTKLRILLVQK